MTTAEAQTVISDGCRRVSNLTSLIQVMALAANAEGRALSNRVAVDWEGLLEIALEQISAIPGKLDVVENFLNHQFYSELEVKRGGPLV